VRTDSPQTASPQGPRKASPQTIVIWTVVALVCAAGWSVLALSRGEEVSAVWMVAAALGSYAIAYRFYSKFIAYKVLKVDKTRATPAERLDNGIDFHPTDRRVCSATTSRRSRGRAPSSAPYWPRRWAICRAPSGSSSA
jgi:carbon starvation protein